MIKLTSGRRNALIAMILALIASQVFLSQMAKRESDAYNAAIEFVEEQDDVLQLTGEIRDYGSWVSGNLNSPEGESNFTIKVIGEKGNVSINIKLEITRYGSWKVQDYEILE